MRSRQAACDPCRKAKLACDHSRPCCSRCRNQGKSSLCVYRATPFKRKRTAASPQMPREGPSPHDNHPETPTVSQTPGTRRTQLYPNPGHLGRSSHVTIFNEIFPEDVDQDIMNNSPAAIRNRSPASVYPEQTALDVDPQVKQAADLIKSLAERFGLRHLQDLVSFWIKKGINLALAEPFVAMFSKYTNYSCLTSFEDTDWHLELASKLSRNTNRPLTVTASTTLAAFADAFLGVNTRWESVGIFMCAVLRASMDVPFFPPLYSTNEQKVELRELSLRLATSSLDICVSLDCLNDMQHVLQYEHCIIHSYIYGDQSYHMWRRVGDVISSIMALGYHEDLSKKADTPMFLIELQKAAFARIYSLDKNSSLFLGRPLRLSKRFCHFQLPDSRLLLDCQSPMSNDLELYQWDPNSNMNYRADSRWSALCAFVKEDAIELLFDNNRSDCRQTIDALQNLADKHWNALPMHFRVRDSIRNHSESPFERDFVASIRLNHLHLIFLLRRLAWDRLSETSGPLIEVAMETLKLVVELIVLREELSNSGSKLSWKISHYGLPAAGIILLVMLNSHATPPNLRASRSRVLQDLAVLTTEIKRGTIAKAGDPNHGLLTKAAQTIHRFLNQTLSDESSCQLYAAPLVPERPHDEVMWEQQFGQEIRESEFSFWEGIADHPFLDGQYLLTEGDGVDELYVPESQQL
ncbi:hypothetical protein V3481_018353 [Fusarium oxysporum f. sp. vasinfectum]|uniref:Zn(2)-C6 fungal-type domain-containing protein n=1 Tax=Fusarium oxysporum f. sp. vasinfectum 25433 TaxID=1089449 RepID=X0KMJ8_FUSOX|nr:hypothetical protein FOTG_16814 [Fusarium oxysporum f. sp. vasinfectum 25433]